MGNAASVAMSASLIGKEDVLLVTGLAMRIVTVTCASSCHALSAAVFIWSHMKIQTSVLRHRRRTLVVMLVDDYVVGQPLLIAIPGVRATIMSAVPAGPVKVAQTVADSVTRTIVTCDVRIFRGCGGTFHGLRTTRNSEILRMGLEVRFLISRR